MQDIKPDTSLYTDLPNKLRAMAMILDAPIEERQFLFSNGWGTTGASDTTAVGFLSSGHNYRIKPKPRELWAAQAPDGSLNKDGIGRIVMYAARPATLGEYKPVRFVESPE